MKFDEFTDGINIYDNCSFYIAYADKKNISGRYHSTIRLVKSFQIIAL